MSSLNITVKNETNKRYYHKNKIRLREVQRIRSKLDYKNPQKRRKKLANQLAFRIRHPERSIIHRIKSAALQRGLEFNLEESDIIIPELCPVFNTPMVVATRHSSPDSPSVDRIDNSKGYIKGNIWIISRRANMIKNDASLEDLKMIVSALEKKYV